MAALESKRSALACAVLLALVATVVFLQHGTAIALLHDDAIFAYGGQQMLHGVAPYVSIFDHKGPLTTILCALGAWIGELAGIDPLLAMRRLFLLCGVLAVVGVFALARALLGSTRAGLLAGAMLLSCARLGYHCAGGPQAKVAMLAFEVGALVAMVRGRWFWAGCSGALSALVWQPTAVFAAAAVFLAAAGAPSGQRLRRFASASAGVLVPLAACSLYFASQGAFGAFLEGAVWFNVHYLESPGSLRGNLFEIGEAIYFSNTGLGFPIVVGLLAIPLLFLASARRRGLLGALTSDPRAALYVTWPWPFVWSAYDFQGHPDFFVFLPFAALGFAWILDLALRSIAQELALAPGKAAWLWGGSAVAFAAGGAFVGRYFDAEPLGPQRAEVAELFASAPPGARWVSLGAPQAMVLGEKCNSTRYGFLMRGIDRLIEDTEPGGFAGWLDSLGEPDGGVLVGRVVLRSIGAEHLASLETWLARFELDEAASRSWLVYRPRATQPGS